MGTILNKVIRIAKIEMADGRYKIRAADGDLYSFFQFKSGLVDGKKVHTQAYEHFMGNNHNEQFNQEDVVQIGYTESEKMNKEGKMVVYKNIISMFPSDETPSQAQPQPRPQPPIHQPGEVMSSRVQTAPQPQYESREAYGRRLAVHGMANGLLASGKDISEVNQMLPQLMELEMSIEKQLTTISPSEIPF